MKDTVYLVFNRSGVDRMVKNEPSTLKPTERAVKVQLEVDDAVFKPPQVATIKISVPVDQVIAPVEVESSFAAPGGTVPAQRGLGGR